LHTQKIIAMLNPSQSPCQILWYQTKCQLLKRYSHIAVINGIGCHESV